MALKAIHASDVPNRPALNIPDNPNPNPNPNAAFLLNPPFSPGGAAEGGRKGYCNNKLGKLVVMGHRGCGMNMLESSDRRMKCWKENSIKSFNHAAQFHLDFIEFDVQNEREKKFADSLENLRILKVNLANPRNGCSLKLKNEGGRIAGKWGNWLIELGYDSF